MTWPPNHMAYSSRRFHRKASVFSAESLYLLVVLVAALATAYWAGRSIGVNLSVINTAASVLGIEETQATAPQVGSQAPTTLQDTASRGAYCQPGEQPSFTNGMAALHAQVGDAMGTPLECEHASAIAGETVQQTSTGLAVYDSGTNGESFTDGWHHWELGPDGLVTWDGTSAEPPAATPSDPAAE